MRRNVHDIKKLLILNQVQHKLFRYNIKTKLVKFSYKSKIIITNKNRILSQNLKYHYKFVRNRLNINLKTAL